MFEILVFTTTRPEPIVLVCETEGTALALIKEELLWENTLRVQCEALDLNLTGSYH